MRRRIGMSSSLLMCESDHLSSTTRLTACPVNLISPSRTPWHNSLASKVDASSSKLSRRQYLAKKNLTRHRQQIVTTKEEIWSTRIKLFCVSCSTQPWTSSLWPIRKPWTYTQTGTVNANSLIKSLLAHACIGARIARTPSLTNRKSARHSLPRFSRLGVLSALRAVVGSHSPTHMCPFLRRRRTAPWILVVDSGRTRLRRELLPLLMCYLSLF